MCQYRWNTSDLGLHCLHMSFCLDTLVFKILGHLPYCNMIRCSVLHLVDVPTLSDHTQLKHCSPMNWEHPLDMIQKARSFNYSNIWFYFFIVAQFGKQHGLKMDPKKFAYKQKCLSYYVYRKWHFVWIHHDIFGHEGFCFRSQLLHYKEVVIFIFREYQIKLTLHRKTNLELRYVDIWYIPFLC